MTSERLLKEKESKIFWKYVLPSVAGMVGMSLYIFADTFFIANGIGPAGLTALNIALPIFGFMSGLGLMIGVGGATTFSIAKGRGNSKKQNTTFTLAFIMSAIIGIIFTLVGVLYAKEIGYMLGATETSIDMVEIYIRTVLMFFWAFMLNNNLSAFIRNDGAPKLAMTAMLISTLSNVILDYIFVFPLKLGIFGAALATGMSPIISLSILSYHFIKKRNSFRFIKVKVSFIRIREVLSGGVTSFLTEISMSIVIFIFNLFIIKFQGDIGVSAYAIITNFAYIAVAIFNGIGQGIQPIISVNYGAMKKERVLNILNLSVKVAFITGMICFICGLVLPEQLVAMFNSEGSIELRNIAVPAVRIYFSAFMFMGVNMIMGLFLQSVSMPSNSAILSMFRGTIFVIIAVFLLSPLLQINGVWLAVPCAEIATLVLSFIFYKKFKASLC